MICLLFAVWSCSVFAWGKERPRVGRGALSAAGKKGEGPGGT
jgi:hypothetical protein